MGNTFC